ncbi:MAG: DEAD/DEAH box helicase family protein [Alphaproteobacteria bacterium]
MTFILRPRQTEILGEVRRHIAAGAKRILIQAPTGFGKTVLGAKILEGAAKKGNRAFFMVHRRELIRQSYQTLAQSSDISMGVVAARFPDERHRQTQICSVQTLGNRLHLIPQPALILWDEAHHNAAASWRRVFQQYPDAVHIGMTATPRRLDGRGLDDFFDVMVPGPAISDLIAEGWLSDYALYAPSHADLTGVRSLGGDYHKGDLDKAMRGSSVTGDAVKEYIRHAGGKRAIAFVWSIEASIDLVRRFNVAGVAAEHVDGNTDDVIRDGAMQRFIAGDTLVLCNYDLYSEGVDVPAVEAIIMLQPTKSLTRYMQQVGRALRVAEGKDRAIILDHAGNSEQHGLPDDEREWTLEGVKKKTKKPEAPGIKMCPECLRYVVSVARECRYCGFRFVVQFRDVDELDGELSAVDVERIRREKKVEIWQAKTEDDLKALARARGYKQGWVKHIMQAREKRQGTG